MTDTARPKFAILGQRKLRMVDLASTRGHNAREVEVGNAVADGPAPVVVLGDPDTHRAVGDRLSDLGIQPRRDAVVAIELMMTTSPEWWIDLTDGFATTMQTNAFERLALRYMHRRFPEEAIISMVWHHDEQTPHLHACALPIRRHVDRRRRDPVEAWALSARGDLEEKDLAKRCRTSIGDRGQMAREQTIFAEVMAPLKLARGKVWSGAPNKPNAVHQAEMRGATAAAQVQREGLIRERADMAVDREEITRQKAAACRMLADAEQAKAAAAKVLSDAEAIRAAARAEAAAIAAGAVDLKRREDEFEEKRVRARLWAAKLKAKADDTAAAGDRHRKGIASLARLSADAVAVHRAIEAMQVTDARHRTARDLIETLMANVSRTERADPVFASALGRAGSRHVAS